MEVVGDDEAPFVDEIVGLWQEVLEREVGLHDHFFSDLGGNSMSAVQMVMSVEEDLGVAVPIGDLFDAPTPVEFASVVDRLRGQPAAEPHR